MEWTSIITELGGGPYALIIAVLGWAYWQKSKRVDEMVDRMLDRSENHIEEGMRREADAIRSMDQLREVVLAKWGGNNV